MNWLSHWDETLFDEEIRLEEIELTDSKTISDFEIPTEEEINKLFG